MIGLRFLWTLCILTCTSQMDYDGSEIDEVSVLFPNKSRFLKRLENANYEVVEKNLDLSKMNISTLQKLNSLKNSEEFAKFFGFFTPSVSTRIRTDVADPLTAEEKIPEAANVGCAPVPTIVPLTPKADASVIYYPTCVLIEKCGGCCYGTLLSCQPVDVEKVKFNVMKINQGIEANPKERPPRTDVKQEFETIIEEKHKSCACKCVLMAKDCNKELQVYDANECSCKCKNKSGPSNCESNDANHYWDAKKCLCLCRKVLDCSTGEKFDQKTCKCVSQLGDIGVNVRIG